MTDTTNEAKTIAKQNDVFRQFPSFSEFYGIKGQIVITQGIQALPEEDKAEIFKSVMEFDTFTKDNDPYGEHDFGAFTHKGNKIFWKIDLYDPDYLMGSPDRINLDHTRRVLTIMLASEY